MHANDSQQANPRHVGWQPLPHFIRALIYAVPAGAGMGICFFAMTYLMRNWLQAMDFENLPAVSIRAHAAVLFPALLLGAVLGAGVLRMADRLVQLWGWALWVPAALAAVVAVSVSILLSRAMIHPWMIVLWWTHGAFGCGAAGYPAVRIYRED